MLYREIIAVFSHIHTKHINTLCGQNVELLNVKLVAEKVDLFRKQFTKMSKESAVLIFRLEYGCSIFLRKVSISLQEWTASHSSRRETERHTQRGTDCCTLPLAKARRFQDATVSEQTMEWFCNAARSAVEVVFGFAVSLFAAHSAAC